MPQWLEPLQAWSSIDTWIVVTAALCAMACALPGAFLLLRRQSMMGDALSHSVLLGIALAFLVAYGLKSRGVVDEATYRATWHTAMFAGAVLIGVATAVLTEMVRRSGEMESSAALGVTYTSLFALGLLLIRLVADKVDLDPGCVIYGNIEAVALDRLGAWVWHLPRGAAVNGGVLLANLVLVTLFFKELRISTFDPELSTSLGIRADVMHYGLMAVTAVTVVAAFESVGSILVIAMLIVPPATAYLLTRRLGQMIAVSLVVAAATAVVGHVSAITLPGAMFGALGFSSVADASTSGMMAVTGGVLFSLALVASPHQGLVARAIRRLAWNVRVAREDVLGLLYRLEEMRVPAAPQEVYRLLREGHAVAGWLLKWALWQLRRERMIEAEAEQRLRLTERGRAAAQNVVRSHRLWETFLQRYFGASDERQHVSAHVTEHFIDRRLREELAAELNRPETDPQGRTIPPPPAKPGSQG